MTYRKPFEQFVCDDPAVCAGRKRIREERNLPKVEGLDHCPDCGHWDEPAFYFSHRPVVRSADRS